MACFCTLFNSLYLDKGIITIKSLKEVSPESYIYVFAFDDKCYEVLRDLSFSNVRLVSLAEFETKELLQIKRERSNRAYCWTCTPFILKHVLEKCNEKQCTYIDADMYFYSDPQVLLDEIDEAKCDVGIVEHRFGRGKIQEQQLDIAGRFCVEFNTFKKNENGMKVLNWWADRCAECCTDDTSQSKDGKFGDQMYLNDWPERFHGIHIMKNHGGGVAPWNIYRYKQLKSNNDEIIIKDIQENGVYKLVFYHFHGISIYSETECNISVFGRYGHPKKRLVYSLYKEYVNKCLSERIEINKKYSVIFPKMNKMEKKGKITDIIHIRSMLKNRKDCLKIGD